MMDRSFVAIFVMSWFVGCSADKTRPEADQLPETYRQETSDILRVGELLGSDTSANFSRKRALEWLGNVPSSFKVAELVLANDASELRMSFKGAGSGSVEQEAGFDHIIRGILRFSTGGDPMSAKPAARMLKIGNYALFSYRHPGLMMTGRSGVSEEIVLGNQDPTKVVPTIRLLLASPTSQERNPEVTLFAKSYEEPTCESCFQLLDQYGGMFSNTKVSARLREHIWFDGEYFPIIFRFEPDTSKTRRYALGSHPVRWPDVYSFYRMFIEVNCNADSKRTCVTYNRHLADKVR